MMRFILFLFPCLLAVQNGFANEPTHTQNVQLIVVVDKLIHVSCAGEANGSISLLVQQGQAPFNFDWSNGASGPEALNLSAGLYSVTITDATNEQAVLTNIEIDEPAPLTLAVSSIQNINCLFPTGSLSVLAAGGSPSYQYLWNTGQTSASANQLAAGNYTITVTDQHGCNTTTGATIQQNLTPPLANAGPPKNLLCSNTTNQLSGSGTTGPTITYQWTAQNGGNIVSGANTLQPTVNHNGTYLLTVTNTTNSCTAGSTTTVSSQFQAPAATASGGTLNCLNSSLQLQASAEPYNTHYGWQGPNGFTSLLLHPVVSVVGNYVLTVTDTVTTCVSQATATVLSDMVHPVVMATVNNVISCITPTTFLEATSTPTSVGFQWSGPNNFSSNQAQPTVNLAGLYAVTVTNPINGCTGTNSVTVIGNTTPPTVTAAVSGMLTCTIQSVTLTGNIQPAFGANYGWTGPNGYTSNLLSPVVSNPGAYTLTATNVQNGCSASSSVTVIRDIAPPNLSATGGTKTCANPNVTLYANSGTPGATFLWSGPSGFSSTQQNPVVSQAGFYTVVATNPATGCSNSVSVNVATNLTQPILLVNGATITCANPIGKPTASSMTPGATFFWTGPGGFTSPLANPQVTLPGFYTVVATNPANGCTTAAPVTVLDNTTPPIAYAGLPQNLSCTGAAIILSGNGSSTGNTITYLWTTFDGHIVAGNFGLFARVDAIGTYTLKVTNTTNGCMGLDSVEVSQDLPVNITINPIVHVACNGTATGSATAKPSGGNGSYTYGWSNGSKLATATGLAAGLFTVTVTDSEGCSASSQVLINQPSLLQGIVSVTPQTMVGLNNGTANITPSGGTSPYTFKWSTNATTPTISNLAPGVYTVTVTDNKGCTLVKTANINAVNCALTGTLATTNVTCSGAANGSATANMTGGTNPITYLWTNNAQTKTISNLAPGTYKVTATDASGCSTVLNTLITSPDPLTLAVAAKENVLCPTSKTGLITAGPTGGTAPYTYVWSTGASGATATGLSPGNYTVTATDAHGCSKNLSAQITVTDQLPPHLVLKNATVALNATGTATVTPNLFDNGSFDMECSIASWAVSPTTFDCTQLGARTVTLTATDASGNSSTGTATVTVTDNIAPTLVCPANKITGTCAPVVQFGQPQVTDNCTVNPAQIQLKSGLPSGSTFPFGKTVQVFSYTDASGNSGECTFEILVNSSPEATISNTPATCAGTCDGTATVSLSGADVPTELHWSNGQSGLYASGLCTTIYSVTVTDSYGCSQQLSTVIPNTNNASFSVSSGIDPVTCAASCDGSVSLSLNGGTAPFEIAWSNGQSGVNANNLCAGSYVATVTDAHGCHQEKSIQITVVDNVIPTLICPANITTAYCASTVTYTLPQVTDNCTVDQQQLKLLSGLPSGSVFPQGQTVQMFSYTDASGNKGQCSFMVTIAPAPATTNTVYDASCNGFCNGQATINTTGGFGPFNMQWSNGYSGPTATSLCAGAYTVTLTDAAGCSQTIPVTVQQPAPIEIGVIQKNDDVGNAGIGSIQIGVIGGNAPYTFAWKRNGQAFSTAQNISNLQAGQYTLVVTDAKGCSATGATLTIGNTVATQEAVWASGLHLQPNPASTFVRLVLNEPLGQEAEVRVVSASGAIVHSETIAASDTSLQLDVQDLPAGFWLVQVRTTDGRETVKKLILER